MPVVTETFDASTSWTCPSDVFSVNAACWGAGGGIGLADGFHGAGGGGGGGYSSGDVIVVPGETYTVTVGVGGATNVSGGDSWFKSLSTVKARGGNRGSITNGGSGGAAAGGFGSTKYSGGNGGNATATLGGGGGAAAGSSLNGANASGQAPGTGAAGGGSGGVAGGSGESGHSGVAPGGGAGGGGDDSLTGTQPVGANGRVVLVYTTPDPPPTTEINIAGNCCVFTRASDGAVLIPGVPGRSIYVQGCTLMPVLDASEPTSCGLYDGEGEQVIPRMNFASGSDNIGIPIVLPFCEEGWGVCTPGASLVAITTNGFDGQITFVIK